MDLERLFGSKYIQSALDAKVYRNVKDDLKNGKKVLFSGTPCQIAGLKILLSPSEAENVLFVEILCHGVPNQWSFDRCIEDENQRIGGEIYQFHFRYKDDGLPDSCNFQYCFNKKGKKYSRTGTSRYFSFFNAFYSYSIFRESCYECKFRGSHSGDIVLGDFWGLDRLDANENTDLNKSLMVPLNEKGIAIVGRIGTETSICLDDIRSYNSGFEDPKVNRDFEGFFDDLENGRAFKYRANPSDRIKICAKNAIKRMLNLISKYKRKYTFALYKTKKIQD